MMDILFTQPWHWVVAGSGATAFAGWLWHRMAVRQQQALFEQQLKTETTMLESKNQQLAEQVRSQEVELDGLDVERDRLTAELRQQHGRLTSAIEKLKYAETIRTERDALRERNEQLRDRSSALEARLREQQARHEQQLQAAEEKIALLNDAETRLQNQFEHLAGQIFEQKTRSVDEQNRMSLETLLGPLKSQLEGFHKQVSDNFGEQAKERHTLVHEIRNLQKLNEQMAQEAVNLTQALKGDNKQQGNWGEVVLTRVLEESGLREGYEYEVQVSLANEDGKRYQPDVIVRLPHEKDVIVDAKMVLVAYERYFHADSNAERDIALRDHIAAIRNHIRGLGQKDYHQLKGVRSLDYVLMFIPVEPAFQVAIQADPSLVRDALEHNIMLVSPTTLLVALRTINNLWRYERQGQNAKVIADKAAKLYDKLRLFVNDIEAIGVSLDKAGQSYQGALNKLATGRGNILSQAESFRSLGVEVKREISPALVASAHQSDRQGNELHEAGGLEPGVAIQYTKPSDLGEEHD
ncbi:DNA recombination protein RmuC [Parasalinivibrio latis]